MNTANASPVRIVASVTKPLSWQPSTLHIMIGCTCAGYTDVTSAGDFTAFLAGNPDIGTVVVYDTRFPRRAVPLDVFLTKHARKLWKILPATVRPAL